MNTYNGFNLRNSVTAAFVSVLMVAGSMMFSATYTNVPAQIGRRSLDGSGSLPLPAIFCPKASTYLEKSLSSSARTSSPMIAAWP